MQCDYYDTGRCRSCTLLEVPYADQLAGKQAQVAALLPPLDWAPPVPSRPERFRNKAKLVVGGSIEDPSLGIIGQDLRHCGLHRPGLERAIEVLAEFVTRASLAPYDIAARRGELKHLLLTESPDGELMVRFVCRSQEPVARLRKHLPWLTDLLPARVVSVNLQPEHKAVLEGEREILLTEQASLPMSINGLTLQLRPQSFFQTNTEVAAQLYAQARDWAAQIAPTTVWDLYCGVGGFARHLAAPGRTVTGVELSEEAVRAAASSSGAQEGLDFVTADAATWVGERPAPDLVVLNPPRAGIRDLADRLEALAAPDLLYSSCQAESLARDLARMPSYRPVRGRLLDMFPQTGHYEVLVHLRRL